jgi:molybdate transport system permease protein
MDWGCKLSVAQEFAHPPEHVAIRAHHIRIHPPDYFVAKNFRKNIFPCWLAAMTETPFRVTLDLRIGLAPSNANDFHVQAEVFKQEWESFRNLPQPWAMELTAERLFLLPD